MSDADARLLEGPIESACGDDETMFLPSASFGGPMCDLSGRLWSIGRACAEGRDKPPVIELSRRID